MDEVDGDEAVDHDIACHPAGVRQGKDGFCHGLIEELKAVNHKQIHFYYFNIN